jgi:hypothetical protein
MKFKGVDIPTHLENCRNVWLYCENSLWVISSRSAKLASFQSESDALNWWKEYEASRGFSVKTPKLSKPPIRSRKTPSSKNTTSASANIQSRSIFRQTTPEHRQALLAKINQGRFDAEQQLLNLRKNATD